MFEIRGIARVGLGLLALALIFWRAALTITSLNSGDEAALLAFPLTVIFPALLVAILLSMPPTKTREGLLMRVGTVLHLLLILSLPNFALYLALGFPFVFLTVEIFETRLPARLTAPLSRLVLK